MESLTKATRPVPLRGLAPQGVGLLDMFFLEVWDKIWSWSPRILFLCGLFTIPFRTGIGQSKTSQIAAQTHRVVRKMWDCNLVLEKERWEMNGVA